MKRITGMLAVAVIVAFVAAGCGSSDSGDGTNPSVTPAATSTKTVNAMGNASQWMSDSTTMIQGALGSAGTSIKTTGGSISCVGTFSGFTCVVWDDQGSETSTDHMCNITGSYAASTYEYDLEYDCFTYEPSSSALVDGNWTASISFNSAAATSASKDVDFAKEETSSTCDVEEITNVCGETYTVDGGSCTATCDGTLSCTAANASVTVDWTVGSRGISMTDECGTYVMSAGTTASMAFCMPSNSQVILSSTMNGTINGTTIDEDMDVDCTLTY